MNGRIPGIAPSRRRTRLGVAMLAALLSACTPGALTDLPGEVTRAAREQLLNTLAGQYKQRLGSSVNTLIADLGKPGGYLDNPLVRILLPPPVGMALAVARTLQSDADATLLETLMNEVAEQALPGAAPIVQAALSQITPAEAKRLLEGDATAGTEYLKTKTAAALEAALTPVVDAKLADSGAKLIYGELVEAYQAQQAVVPSTDSSVPPPVAAPDLGSYVAERTVDGLFKVLSEREAEIRKDIDRASGGMLSPGGPQLR